MINWMLANICIFLWCNAKSIGVIISFVQPFWRSAVLLGGCKYFFKILEDLTKRMHKTNDPFLQKHFNKQNKLKKSFSTKQKDYVYDLVH